MAKLGRTGWLYSPPERVLLGFKGRKGWDKLDLSWDGEEGGEKECGKG